MRWKVAGAPCSPKGRTRYCQWPRGVEKAVLGLARSVSGTCQYPLGQIERGDEPGSPQSIQELIDTWHRVPVELRDLVYAAEVITKPEGAIWFWDHHDGATPGTAGGLNYS